ncbi:ABC transporter substrate-binding protein [Paenibacillus antri]|uniref:ABC transporter substrate-binding protein n=1 Tax=Paenibacillus antri TaxID=2582848 RepID=A0A5R9G1P1_9BACL|nr:ABC transporter substrate-binding protein [Paenibacillus antri]TLS50252.1 ABC transporter substrate-binding protein [Paenibacillus antri]
MSLRTSWKAISLVLAAATLTFAVGCSNQGSGEKVYQVGISQIVEHPSLDATREGFIAGLKDAGLVEGENLKIAYSNAQGDNSTNATIAQNFKADKKDLVLGIATPSAVALADAIKDAPVLFTAVTDPIGAGLLENPEKPGGNVTGVSDTHPDEIAKLMDFIAANFPDVKTVGTVINQGEQNAVVSIERAQAAMDAHGVKIETAAVTNSSEVKQAAESLVGRVDAIYIPKDNTVVSAFEAVVGVANEKKLPLFVGDIDSVKRGAFATFGYEYYDIGYTTGKMAADILLNGKNPGDVPVGFPEQLDLYYSEPAAAAQGVEVTQAIRDLISDEAVQVIKEVAQP